MINKIDIKILKLTSTAVIPTYATPYAAGADLYADHIDGEYMIGPKTRINIPTGIAMQIPDGYVGLLFPRSGLSIKQGLNLSNCVGVIDSDYRGEIFVSLYNNNDYYRTINPGDRIAQIMFVKYNTANFIVSDSLSDTGRGNKGLGSTGK